jgi:hypothetical protein
LTKEVFRVVFKSQRSNSEAGFDEEIVETKLALCNIHSFSVHQERNGKTLPSFKVTLIKKFIIEQLCPLVADFPGFCGVRNISKMEKHIKGDLLIFGQWLVFGISYYGFELIN